MLLASLALEKEPLQWASLPASVMSWTETAGALAALGLLLWLVSRLLQREPILVLSRQVPASQRNLLTNLFVGAAVVGISYYAVLLLLWVGRSFGMSPSGAWFPRSRPEQSLTTGDYGLLISGGMSLFLVALPILWSLATRIRLGRIVAISRLSFKEAVRGRIILVFSGIALVFLFAGFFVPYRDEDQIRNYVRVVYWSLTFLFLLPSILLGAFSIPNDVNNNSIHTIVTKPVERYEVVLGRFFGYATILTLSLLVVSALSLVYVVRGVNEKAREESYKARVAEYGKLHFGGTKDAQRAESVGREWGYRSYITGATYRSPNAKRAYAIWDFAEVPTDAATRDQPYRFEYTFDIFRMSKGEEGKGMHVTFTFADPTRHWQDLDVLANQLNEERNNMEAEVNKKYEAALRQNPTAEGRKEARKERDKQREDIPRALVRKYHLFQVRGQEVKDYHTQDFTVPPYVFEEILRDHPARAKLQPDAPMMRVFVTVDIAKEAQMLGVARSDFYLVAQERPFWQNFLKGIVGMWCIYMLLLGVAVACSTYLSGVISLLCTLFLYGAGLSTEYLREIAEQRRDILGGGPIEAAIRTATGMPVAAQLDATPTTSLVQTVDSLFSWWIGRILSLIPDLNRYDLHHYVANGFDIGWGEILLLDNIIPLIGYLLPWAIFAYYLMKYREIANPQ
jgi:hypothetical protein